MFNFFKRSDKVSNSPAPRSPSPITKASRARSLDLLEPLPLPQVHEGNQDSDWAMWQDSVMEQDSHPPSQFAETTPSHFDSESQTAADAAAAADPFAQVSKNAP